MNGFNRKHYNECKRFQELILTEHNRDNADYQVIWETGDISFVGIDNQHSKDLARFIEKPDLRFIYCPYCCEEL